MIYSFAIFETIFALNIKNFQTQIYSDIKNYRTQLIIHSHGSIAGYLAIARFAGLLATLVSYQNGGTRLKDENCSSISDRPLSSFALNRTGVNAIIKLLTNGLACFWPKGGYQRGSLRKSQQNGDY